ncbi:thioredoxin family protein [Streptosporangium algeriense]|uniref:Thioredoxin family protein n=1 Tax=Streptosporangium algeriense TaxID=1682748 RepID=A0ABW3DQ19_9ACTN
MRRARATLIATAVGGVLAAGLAAAPAHANPLISHEGGGLCHTSQSPCRGDQADATFPAGTVQFTDASFPSAVLNSPKPVLVNFCAVWSGVCRALEPELEKVAAERDGRVVVGTLDIDQNPVTPRRYNVNTIPALLLFKNGTVVAKRVGPLTKNDVLRLIDPHL